MIIKNLKKTKPELSQVNAGEKKGHQKDRKEKYFRRYSNKLFRTNLHKGS